MTEALRLERKLDECCTRCGAPASAETFLCETHRTANNAGAAAGMKSLRAQRRARQECADCEAPGCATYRCASCQRKRYEPAGRFLTPSIAA